ncbi:hypothetical protein E6H32_05500 [Candidatus Bathyarchaeota archaeon]|nr:MAG: hypothetical protein E6H32_05500 [Candidatus Bathyarchaeota archaeon]
MQSIWLKVREWFLLDITLLYPRIFYNMVSLAISKDLYPPLLRRSMFLLAKIWFFMRISEAKFHAGSGVVFQGSSF